MAGMKTSTSLRHASALPAAADTTRARSCRGVSPSAWLTESDDPVEAETLPATPLPRSRLLCSNPAHTELGFSRRRLIAVQRERIRPPRRFDMSTAQPPTAVAIRPFQVNVSEAEL